MATSSIPCPGCTERDQRILQLEHENARLQQKVADLQSRLDQTERDGKRQAAPFSKGHPEPNPKKPGRKAGEKYGQHAHRPTPLEIDEILEAPLPDKCPRCGCAICEDDDVDEQYQTDIPTKPIHRKFRIHKGTCTRCGKRVRGRHPLQTSDATGAAASQIGPNAQAAMIYLNKKSGMSYGKIANFMKEVHGITVRPSTATRTVLRVGERLRPVYDEIKTSFKDCDTIIPDESGWRNGGRPVWIHAWVGKRAEEQIVCYTIGPQRSADYLESVIGIDYSGTMIHDGYATYDRFKEAKHQQCLDHGMRRAAALEEKLEGRNKQFPHQVKELFKEALQTRDEFEANPPTDEDARGEKFLEFCDRLEKLTEGPRADPENQRFANHLNKHGGEWFTFLLQPGQPATNCDAEQALKTPIVNRKTSGGGNREDAGARAQETLSTVIATNERQERSAFGYIKAAVCGVVRSLVSWMSEPAAEPSEDTGKEEGAGGR